MLESFPYLLLPSCTVILWTRTCAQISSPTEFPVSALLAQSTSSQARRVSPAKGFFVKHLSTFPNGFTSKGKPSNSLAFISVTYCSLRPYQTRKWT